jgi:hypothetical protein
MNLRHIHFISGLILCVFIAMHLFNHLYGILGAERHIALMGTLRLFYRNIVSETLLLAACLTQVVSGIALVRRRDREALGKFDKLQVWSGLYLSFFLVFHIGAVMVGRFVLHLDTNYYFGVAGMNAFPTMLFFIPYYTLAIMAVTGHIAAIHGRKATRYLLGFSPQQQAYAILVVGFCITLATFYALTDHFHGVTVPEAYNVLILK